METVWLIKLREQVLGPLKKITELAGGAQKKITGIATATSKFARENTIAGNVAKNSLTSLTEKLRQLESLQAKAWDTRHIQNYQRAINKTKSDIAAWHQRTRLPEMEAPKMGWMGKFKTQMSEAFQGTSIGGTLSMLRSPVLLGGAALAAGLSFGKASVDNAMNFEYGMAKINATAQLPTANLEKLKNRLQDIGMHSGGNYDRITDAYEKILSVTGKVNLSLGVMETAVKGAKAGFTDIDVVAGALARTMAVVGEQNTTANEVMDTLLKAKGVGAGEFGDFAQYLPSLIASGRNLGATFKETAGLFSFMTFKGNSATDSAMLIQNAFTALQKKDILVGLKKKGIDLFDVHGARRSIKTIFLELTKQLSTLTDKQRTKYLLDIGLNDAQARTAFSVLTSDAKEFNRIMGEVNNAVGETDRQLAATGNRKTTWAELGDQWKKIGTDFGTVIMPLVDILTQATQGLLNSTKEFTSTANWKKAGDNISSLWSLSKGERDIMATDKIDAIILKSFKDLYGQPHKKGELIPGSKTSKWQSDWNPVGNPNDFTFKDQNVAAFKSFQKAALPGWRKAFGLEADPNMIDPNEKKTAPAPLAALNGIDNTDFGKTKSDKEKDGNGGLRTLIMNLEINNKIETKEDAEKFRRKFTDDIVDAARDGMVTIGID